MLLNSCIKKDKANNLTPILNWRFAQKEKIELKLE